MHYTGTRTRALTHRWLATPRLQSHAQPWRAERTERTKRDSWTLTITTMYETQRTPETNLTSNAHGLPETKGTPGTKNLLNKTKRTGKGVRGAVTGSWDRSYKHYWSVPRKGGRGRVGLQARRSLNRLRQLVSACWQLVLARFYYDHFN